MIWSYIIIFRPPEHRIHHLNPKWSDLISSPFMYAFRVSSTYMKQKRKIKYKSSNQMQGTVYVWEQGEIRPPIWGRRTMTGKKRDRGFLDSVSSCVSSGCFYLGMNTYIGCTCVYVLERGEIRPPIWGRWTGKKRQRVLTQCWC